MAERPTRKNVVRWNDDMARKHDSEAFHLRSSALIRWIERRRVAAVVAFLNAHPGDTVLELGCGAGVVLEQLPAEKRIGLDLSGSILQRTRARLADKHALLVQADAERVPLASRAYQKIVCTEVIEHVLEPTRVIAEIARIASLDSVVVLTIPNERLIDKLKAVVRRLRLPRWLLQGGQHSGAAYDSPEDANEWHLHRYDLALLLRQLEPLLSVVGVRAIPCGWLPLRYVVSCRVQDRGANA